MQLTCRTAVIPILYIILLMGSSDEIVQMSSVSEAYRPGSIHAVDSVDFLQMEIGMFN